MEEIMDINFVQEAADTVAAEPVRKAKKKKAVAEPVIETAMENKTSVNLRYGVVVYANQHTGEIGIEADGVGYQMPDHKGHKVGDRVSFAIVAGKPVLQ